MNPNLPRSLYLKAAAQLPLVTALTGVALVSGAALAAWAGARAGMARWADFIAPLAGDCECGACGWDDEEDWF